MQYILLLALIILGFFFLYKVIIPLGSPDFQLRGTLPEDELQNSMVEIAKSSKNCRNRGKGLDLYVVKKKIAKAYKTIQCKLKQSECFEFEYWIYDNYYKLCQLLIAKDNYKFCFLPHVDDMPRIYKLCQAIVKGSGGVVTDTLFSECVNAFCGETPLDYQELCMLKSCLSYCMLEFVAIYCSKSIVINRMITKGIRAGIEAHVDLSLLNYNSYVYGLSLKSGVATRNNINAICAENGNDMFIRIDNMMSQVSRYNGSVGSIIESIHGLDKWFDDSFLLGLSRVNAILESEKAICYSNTTIATKKNYLQAIAKSARKSRSCETEQTRKIVFLAKESGKDIASFIIKKPCGSVVAFFHIFALLLVTGLVNFAIFAAFELWQALIMSGLTTPIILIVVSDIAHRFSSHLVPMRFLPSVKIGSVSSSSSATLIVITQLVGSEAELFSAVENAQTICQANCGDSFHVGLLLDFVSATSVEDVGDLHLLSAIDSLYNSLPNKEKFIIFVRKRKLNSQTLVYEGWERKRGAIMQLNELLLDWRNNKPANASTSKADALPQNLHSAKSSENFVKIWGQAAAFEFVIALDSDTIINAARELVEHMLHPYNKKYNIMSIDMRTSSAARTKTLYSKLCSVSSGFGFYDYNCSNHYFDVFDSGNFTGKGIYRLKGFHDKTSHYFLENSILSHDFIEGALVGCAKTSVTAIDSCPTSIGNYQSRQNRWIRGDWQLLPQLMPRVTNEKKERIKNEIKAISKWQIIMNLVSSVVPICALILLFAALFAALLVGNTQLSLTLIVVALLPQAVRLLFAFSLLFRKPIKFLQSIFNILLEVFMLPYYAFNHFVAMSVTLTRLLFTKKNLLCWKTFSTNNSKFNILPNLLVGVFFAAISLFYYLSSGQLFWLVPMIFGLMFLAALPIERLLNLRIVPPKSEVQDEQMLREIAVKTLKFFEDTLVAENNYLPCDNFQFEGGMGWTKRTSPTNVGFALVSVISGYKMKVYDSERRDFYLDKIISTLESQEKWYGNFFNWIDVTTNKPLSPRYISTVDNGNLMICLLVTRQATSGALAARAGALLSGMQLERLFDDKRKLLHIGYNCLSAEFDHNHYDLMASEALITYLMLCGLGKLDKSVWKNLSVSATTDVGKMLFSWTGGMFEYFMSPIFYDFENFWVMNRTLQNVAKTQAKYRSKQDKLWGVSESQYNAQGSDGEYLYKAFGIPSIAFSNITHCETIAPYATFLTLGTSNHASMNINKMVEIGLCGSYGMIEAYDTACDEPINTVMAHHAGMTIAAISNYLDNNYIKKLLHSAPEYRASQLLLDCPESRFGRASRKKSVRTIPRTVETSYVSSGYTVYPQLNMLSNGKYSTIIDNYGNGYSIFEDKLVNFFDGSRYTKGMELNIEYDSQKYSLYGGECHCDNKSSTFQLDNRELHVTTIVTVMHGVNGEAREITLKNNSDRELTLKLSAEMPIVLGAIADYNSHKAYSKMFINTENVENSIVAFRDGEKALLVAFFYDDLSAKYNSNKRNLISNSIFGEVNVASGENTDANNFGQVLEPTLYGEQLITLSPYQEKQIKIFVVVSHDKAFLLKTCRELRSNNIYRLQRKCGVSQERLSLDRLTIDLASQLLYEKKPVQNINLVGSIVNLSYPTIVFNIVNSNSLYLLREKLINLGKLYKFGIRFNVVIVYVEKYSYSMQLLSSINATLSEINYRKYITNSCGLHLINSSDKSKDFFAELNAIAVDFSSIINYKIDLGEQLAANNFLASSSSSSQLKSASSLYSNSSRIYDNAVIPEIELSFPLGIGGYLADGSYYLDLSKTDTPAPWSNIISNGEMGTVITAEGGGYTFVNNAREHKMTKWVNEPTCDIPTECVIIGENRRLWSIAKKPITTSSNYQVIHKLGATQFINNYNGILSIMDAGIATDVNTKLYDVSLSNHTDCTRHLDIMFYCDVVLGDFHLNTDNKTLFSFDGERVIAKDITGSSVAYFGSSLPVDSYSTLKESVLDYDGKIATCSHLLNKGLSPCVAISVRMDLTARETRKVTFYISDKHENSNNNSAHIPREVSHAQQELARAIKINSSISDFEITTNDKSLDYLLKWLPYQILGSRFNGRTGYYQSGGAFGFRDQLQDCLALVYCDKNLVRSHIIDCAAHQFCDGDVQHWWHYPRTGVRTRIMDDRLFLPYVVTDYIKITGDEEILKEKVAYLENVFLPTHNQSVYVAPLVTERKGTVLEHCLRAIDSSCDFGENGLVLMHGGDWNDGMDKVGEKGLGTTVWGTMFLYECVERILPYLETESRKKYEQLNKKLKQATEERGWDGNWYRRAYHDNGKALGSAGSKECKIDLICQAWSVLSGIGEKSRTHAAMRSAKEWLVDEKSRIIKLLTPPITDREIGYIGKYPPGIRENGGQYTHAAIWYIMGLYRLGETKEAYKMIELINPINHSRTRQDTHKYKVEPYVVSADVYAGKFAGMGGWSWYTGASSWLYKCIIEELIGIKIEGDRLTVTPNLPPHIENCSIKMRTKFGEIEIEIENGHILKEWRISAGRILYDSNTIQLTKSLIGKKITIKRV